MLVPILTTRVRVPYFRPVKRLMPVIAGVILTLFSFSAQAYHAKIDSLLRALEQHPALDTARINLLDRTIFLLRYNDPEKAMQLAGEQLQSAQKINYHYGEVFGLNHIGTIYRIMGDIDKAMEHYIKASQYTSDKDPDVSKGVSLALNNIGLIYSENGYFERAESYFRKALEIDLRIGNKRGIAREYGNIGNLYVKQEKYTVAVDYINRGLKIDSLINHKIGVMECLTDLAFANYKMENYPEASAYLDKAEKMNDGLCGSSDGFMVYIKSLISAATGKMDLALNQARQAYELALKTDNTRLLEKTSYNAASLYAQNGDYKRSAEFYPLYIKYQNKTKNEKQIMTLAEIQEKYESGNKQKEIEALEASNEKFEYYNQRLISFRNWLIIAMLVMGVLLLVSLQQYRAKLNVNKVLMNKFAEVRRMNDELNIKNEEIEEKTHRIEENITALRRQEKQLSQAQQIARLGSWEKDIKSGVVTWSQQLYYMLGFAASKGPASLIRCHNVVYQDDRSKVLQALKMLFRHNTPFDIEFRINGRFDTVRVIHFKAQVVNDMGNEKFSGTLQDITEQKETEKKLVWAKEQAESANRTKSLFLANMSHEIRTPMNAILGFADLMIETCQDDQQKEYLTQIRNSGDTLVILLNDILDFNKIEHGKLAIENVNYNFRTQMHSWLAPYKLQAKEKNISVELSVDPVIPEFIIGDPFRTRQLLVNYVSNALKFTNHGLIMINVSADIHRDDQLMLNFRICDSGIGVPPEKQLVIFDLFTQADDSTTRNYGGTGLGLAINKQLSILMGGDTGVTSPGTLSYSYGTPGSDFWFSIKGKKGRVAPVMQHTKTESSAARFQSPPKLLVAEDNPVNQLLMKKVLSNMNCNFLIVDNGAEVITALEKEQFDAILLDIQMPVMDGYQATEIIRNSSRFKDIPIVGVSANVFKEDIQKSLSIGMNAHIGKPFKASELFDTLNFIFRSSLMQG